MKKEIAAGKPKGEERAGAFRASKPKAVFAAAAIVLTAAASALLFEVSLEAPCPAEYTPALIRAHSDLSLEGKAITVEDTTPEVSESGAGGSFIMELCDSGNSYVMTYSVLGNEFAYAWGGEASSAVAQIGGSYFSYEAKGGEESEVISSDVEVIRGLFEVDFKSNFSDLGLVDSGSEGESERAILFASGERSWVLFFEEGTYTLRRLEVVDFDSEGEASEVFLVLVGEGEFLTALPEIPEGEEAETCEVSSEELSEAFTSFLVASLFGGEE